ncbi:MAG: 2-oxoacid:acceptor oxidoreductase subunit alpha [Gemmatimonadetes bacterium]|nr:2-oxoacid:acceptor oxidoreductase subunit alpha [Gemmatimonadota bacterium]
MSGKSGINDFAFKMGTVNGTGSASANGLLMQAIFRMGIPVTGKNIFPSNIQGLPTWYEIRVSKDGYTARPSEVDLVVALNPATYAKDVKTVRPGGYLVYDSTWPMDPDLVREGITILGIPFGRMCVETFEKDRDRTLLRNIAYAGALAALLKIDTAVIEAMLTEKFGKKPKLLAANHTAFKLGYDYAMAHFQCPLPFHLEPMDRTGDSILIDGNTAAALGAVYAGATVGAWYPITPATALMEQFKGFCEKYRVDKETGLHKYAILQAEDELAAAGIIIGAGWAGARAFTNTSGPGISLMQEFIGLAYYTDIPAVFIDVQRCGPATGMPTRTQQADLLSLAYASHGDTKHLIVFPADPRECFEMTVQAFDLAERFQTPVFVASDLDIGMNDWMVKRFEWDDSYRPDRGKVLDAADLEKIQRFSRYLDVDGDGIAARTLPGVGGKGAYFVRGSGHDKHGQYTEDSDAYQELVDRLKRKFEGAAEHVPAPIISHQPGAEVGLVTIGGCEAAVHEAADILRAEGIHTDYMRIRGFPFSEEVRKFLGRHEHTFVIEQNRDAQLRSLVQIELGVARDAMTPILDYSGMPLTAATVVNAVKTHLAEVPA